VLRPNAAVDPNGPAQHAHQTPDYVQSQAGATVTRGNYNATRMRELEGIADEVEKMQRARGSLRIRRHACAHGLDRAASSFFSEYLFFGAAGATALLPAQLGDALGRGALLTEDGAFQLIGEQAARMKPVQRLRAFALALDERSSGTMDEDNTGGDLVDVLPALAAGADEALLDVFFTDSKAFHSFGKRPGFCGRNSKHGANRALPEGHCKLTKRLRKRAVCKVSLMLRAVVADSRVR